MKKLLLKGKPKIKGFPNTVGKNPKSKVFFDNIIFCIINSYSAWMGIVL